MEPADAIVRMLSPWLTRSPWLALRETTTPARGALSCVATRFCFDERCLTWLIYNLCDDLATANSIPNRNAEQRNASGKGRADFLKVERVRPSRASNRNRDISALHCGHMHGRGGHRICRGSIRRRRSIAARIRRVISARACRENSESK
jgi:hypothetical protein